MRDIKFRAWNTEANRMYEVLILADDYIEAKCSTQPMLMEHVDLMQFTGLKDKNGTEIYEGDVVKWGHVDGFIEISGVRVAVVDMSNSCDGLTFDAFKPIAHRFKIGNFAYGNSTDTCMEVIGNIHENPELLSD